MADKKLPVCVDGVEADVAPMTEAEAQEYAERLGGDAARLHLIELDGYWRIYIRSS